MRRKPAFYIALVLILISIFACNRKSKEATAEAPPQKQIVERAKSETNNSIEPYQKSDAPADLQPSPMRNPFVSDPDTVIHIEKTGCYGDCPVFTATILATGASFYQGKQGVEKVGAFTANMHKRVIRKIDEKLSAIEFYEMEGRYPENEKEIIPDLPWIYIFSEFEAKENHIAINHSAPENLKDFILYVEQELDKLRWSPGDVKD